MDWLSFAGALATLLVGALVLNVAYQLLEGRKTVFLHFGLVFLILAVGGVLFLFWGWRSTAWVLGVAAALSLVPPLWDRVFGDGPPPEQVWFGDDPGG